MAGTETLQHRFRLKPVAALKNEFVAPPKGAAVRDRVVGDGRCASPCRAGDRSARLSVRRAGTRVDREAAAACGGERERREHETRNGGSAPADSERVDEPTGDQQRALRERARRELPQRLLELAAQQPTDGDARERAESAMAMGSCTETATSALNWRLVQMPDAVRDYVLLHELMHLKADGTLAEVLGSWWETCARISGGARLAESLQPRRNP